MSKKKPNLLLFGLESLRRDHMSMYGYHRLTTPHIQEYCKKGVVFNNCFSPSVPTTPGYASMLTGMDCFGTDVVALRHQGALTDSIKTMAEVLKENGYNTTSVGFSGNPSSRGFDTYLDFSGWGTWDTGRSPKAENLNAITLPEMDRLAKEDKPFFLFLRHMDPHSPYLAPEPFHKMFYQGDECDPNNDSLDKLYDFEPFRDYFLTWFPPGCTDKNYIDAQYDAEIAYMDTCIQPLLQKLKDLGVEEDTVVVFTSDHGETLFDHDCYYDHHGIYDCTLSVPLAIVYEKGLPSGKRVDDNVFLKDIMPTVLDLMGIDPGLDFDGRKLGDLVYGREFCKEPEFYITEATWMRKHGWRTPEWKLIRALEPDLHFKPPVELYNLIHDPEEYNNLADELPDVVAYLTKRMEDHIARREKKTGRTNPVYTNTNWSGHGKPFESSEEAYRVLHIGDPEAAKKLQARNR